MDDRRLINAPRLQHTHQYVGKKVRRVRWQKLSQSASSTIGGMIPEKFATASWDESGPFSLNEIVLWHLTADNIYGDEGDRGGGGQRVIMDDDDFGTAAVTDIDWKFVRSAGLKVDSDIHEMQFINEDYLLFGTAKGDLVVSKWFRNERRIRPIHIFSKLHGENESCVGFSLFGNDVVSLGSNGTLKQVNLATTPISGRDQVSIETFDEVGENVTSSTIGSLLCIEHFGANEIVTGNAVGQLQIWDLRQRPQSTIRHQLPANIQNNGAVTAVRSHPSQRHILAAGYQSGNLIFWDLRHTTNAMTSSAVDVHSGPIWELAFHPIYPSHLYGASNDGLLLDWDASGVRLVGDNFSVSPWALSTDELRDQVNLTNLIPGNKLPVNSLDVVGDSILAGVDDESVWMIKNLPTS